MAQQSFRITYATMTADNEELHRRYEEAVERARGEMGREHPFYINGEACTGTSFKEERSPIDSDVVIGKFAQGTKQDAKDAIERNEGFTKPMGRLSEAETNIDVLRPYGVWAVISPFNFPMALAGGPTGAALVAGNCVILKPASTGALSAHKLYEALHDAGVPAAAFQLLTGPGSQVGQELQDNPDVDGMTFTGSYEVGMGIYRNFPKDFPKPAICEMGGKNPAIVSAKADLDKATDGVMRSAFGFGGQKCSATSRVYVQRQVFEDFTRLLVEKASKLKVGNPTERDTYTGPVINEKAVQTFQRAVEDVRSGGG